MRADAEPSCTVNARSKLAISYVPIASLKADARNARVHTKKQIRQIARSIEAFGFNVPILVDAGNNVIGGHGRILAAKLHGLAEVPTIRLDHLTDAQRRAFAIADNRLTEIASWDDRLLGETLKELAILDLDFALEAIGFDTGEIDLHIEALSQTERGPAERPIPAVTGPTVTRTGDLWLLGGRHKVLCGSALDAEAYHTLLGPETAHAIFTDPPYNVPVDGNVSGHGQTRHREFPMGAGEMDPAGFTRFLETSLRHMAAFSRSGAVHYVCMDWRHAAELLDASRAAGLDMLNLCVWTKPNAGLGSFYRSQHELVFVFKAGSGQHRNNVQLGRQGRNRTNVWAYAAGPAFGRAGEEGHLAALHPTVKPVAMAADALLDSSRRGDIVLDPFLGSGTTLMAAERTGRKCRGLELDPLYADVIVRRWQAYTGEAARHAVTGATFDEAARAAEAAQ
jgi:DNA modification methylase